jgi:hypothetical protein
VIGNGELILILHSLINGKKPPAMRVRIEKAMPINRKTNRFSVIMFGDSSQQK